MLSVLSIVCIFISKGNFRELSSELTRFISAKFEFDQYSTANDENNTTNNATGGYYIMSSTELTTVTVGVSVVIAFTLLFLMAYLLVSLFLLPVVKKEQEKEDALQEEENIHEEGTHEDEEGKNEIQNSSVSNPMSISPSNKRRSLIIKFFLTKVLWNWDFIIQSIGCVGFYIEFTSFLSLLLYIIGENESFFSKFDYVQLAPENLNIINQILFWVLFVFLCFSMIVVGMRNIVFLGYLLEHGMEKLLDSWCRKDINFVYLFITGFFAFADGFFDGVFFSFQIQENVASSSSYYFKLFLNIISLVLLFGGILGYFSLMFVWCVFPMWGLYILPPLVGFYIVFDVASLIACVIISFLGGVRVDSILLACVAVIEVPLRLMSVIIAMKNDAKASRKKSTVVTPVDSANEELEEVNKEKEKQKDLDRDEDDSDDDEDET